MKRKELIKKGIAGCMAALMTLSSMPVSPAYASDDASTELNVSEEAAEDNNDGENDAAGGEAAETVSPLSITPYIPEISEPAQPEEEDLPANVLKEKDECYGLDMQLTSDKDFPANSDSLLSIIQDGNQVQEYLGNINESILTKNNQQASGYILPIEISVFDSTDEGRKELKDLGKINVNIETESAEEVNGYRLFHMKADKSWEELAFKIDGKNINFESEELGKFIWLNVPDGDGEGDKVVADETVNDNTGDGQQKEKKDDITMTTAGELKDKAPGSEENKKNDISKDLTVNDVKPQEESSAADAEEAEKEIEKKAETDEKTINKDIDAAENEDGIAEGEETGAAEDKDEAGNAEVKDETEDEDTGDEKADVEEIGNEKADAEQAGDESDVENAETEGKEKDWTPDNLNEVQTEIIPSGSVFDAVQNVNGVNVRVHAQAGVFPDGCSMQAEEVNNTEIQERVAYAISKAECQNPVKSYYYNITIYDKDGNEIEPDTTKGKVSVSFDMDELQDKNLDAAVYHIDDNFNADILGSINNSLAVVENGTDVKDTVNNVREETAAAIDENIGETANETTNAIDETDSTDETVDINDGETENEPTNGTDACKNEANEEAGEIGNYGYDDNGSLMINSSMSDEGLTVSTDAFSFYVVSFTYNNKSYDMMAGEEVDLSTIKTSVGLSGDITNAVSSDKSKLSITKEEATDSSGNTSVVWKAKPNETFAGAATLTLTINNVDYVINVTVINSYDKFALLFEDGTLIFVNKSRNLKPLIAEHGKITHKYVVSETSNKHDWTSESNNKAKDIKKVIIMDTIHLTDANGYFAGCSNVSEFVGLENIDMSECEDMAIMFYECNSIEELDLSSWNVSSVKKFTTMFYGCRNLKKLDLHGWIIDNVSGDMNDAFGRMLTECRSLEVLNMDGWSLPNINHVSLSGMADYSISSDCYINMNNWKFKKATSLKNAFYLIYCNDISIKNWDVSNIIDFSYTFQCSQISTSSLTDVECWNVSNGNDFSYMFARTSNIKALNLSQWNMQYAQNIEGMFVESNIKNININNWHFKEVNSDTIGKGFIYNNNLESVEMNNWMWDSFSGFDYPILYKIGIHDMSCVNISFKNLTINISYSDRLHDKNNGIRSDARVDYLDISGWKLPNNLTNLNSAFAYLQPIKYIDCSLWSVSSELLDIGGMFYGCYNACEISINGWKVNNQTNAKIKIKNASAMFGECYAVRSVILNNFNFSYDNLSVIGGIVTQCHSIYEVGFTNCYFNYDDMSHFAEETTISGARSASILDLSGTQFGDRCRSFESMIANTQLKTIKLYGVTFPNFASNYKYMFAFNSKLEQIMLLNCSGLPSNYAYLDITGMFRDDISLRSMNLSAFVNRGPISNAKEVFYNCQTLSEVICTNLRFVGPELNIDGFFFNCDSLLNVDCSGWSAISAPDEAITSLANVFEKMWSDEHRNFVSTSTVENIIINNWQFPDVSNMNYAFAALPHLKKLTCKSGTFGTITSAEGMLSRNASLKTYDISGVDLSSTTTLQAFFYNDTSLKRISDSGLHFMNNPNNVTDIAGFIASCEQLSDIDVSRWNTSKVTSAKGFAKNTHLLEFLDLYNWDMTNIQKNGLDEFANPSGVKKLKLGAGFKFPVYKTFGLSSKKWNHIKNRQVDISSVDLWSLYDQTPKMTGTWIIDNDTLNLDESTMFDDYSYDAGSNTLFAYINAPEGQTVSTISFPDFYQSKILMGDDFFKQCDGIKDFVTNGDFTKKALNLKIQSRAYTNIVGCSRASKVLWTFNVPKNNNNIIKINIVDKQTGQNVGYIANTSKNPNIFTQYSNDGKIIEVLNPENRHTYQDLGYTVTKHHKYLYNYQTNKYGTFDTYYDEYGNLSVFKDNTQPGYNKNNENHKVLSDFIYPEYKDYISYNPNMNNYEVTIAPGKYTITVTDTLYESLMLSPDKIIWKNIDKTDSSGNKVMDKDGNVIKVSVPDKYQYNNQYSIINEDENKITLFNHIYKDAQTRYTIATYNYESVNKYDSFGNLMSTHFLLQSTSSHKWYYAFASHLSADTRFYAVKTDSQNNIIYNSNGDIVTDGYASINNGETFIGYEIKAPDGYQRNPQPFTVTFVSVNVVTCSNFKDLIYNDGTTIPFNSKNNIKCETCMTYGSCTCKKFGSCDCYCCGVSDSSPTNYLPPIEIRNNQKATLYTNPGSVTVINTVDDSATDINKQHTSFNFSVYDKSDNNKLKYNYTIKAGESFNLDTPNLTDGHRYRIVEESFTNDLYSPSDTTIVRTGSANDTDHEWTSDKLYCEFTYSDSQSFYRRYTFTNHYNQQKHNIAVEKHLNTDNSSNKDKTTSFNFTMQLTNPLLSLSDFEIMYQKSDGSSGKVTLDADGKYAFTLRDGQTIKFMDVPDVTTYKFTEEKSGIYHTKDNGTANGMLLEKDANVIFNNDRIDIISLPKTGGDGNTLPYAMLFVVTVSLVAAAKREKKKQKS